MKWYLEAEKSVHGLFLRHILGIYLLRVIVKNVRTASRPILEPVTS
jgi:hypothetical protein